MFFRLIVVYGHFFLIFVTFNLCCSGIIPRCSWILLLTLSIVSSHSTFNLNGYIHNVLTKLFVFVCVCVCVLVFAVFTVHKNEKNTRFHYICMVIYPFAAGVIVFVVFEDLMLDQGFANRLWVKVQVQRNITSQGIIYNITSKLFNHQFWTHTLLTTSNSENIYLPPPDFCLLYTGNGMHST